METLEVKVTDGAKELVLRQGKALELKEPVIINIDGVITAPADWLKTRKDQLNDYSHIVIDRDKMTIKLVMDENNHYGTIITGNLKINNDFNKFGINTGKSYTTYELAEIIKMNRGLFSDKEYAMKLVDTLMNFEAKVTGEVKAKSDNRANTEVLLKNAIDSNIPESFNMNVPIFKGGAKTEFEVEIYISTTYKCQLVSPDSAEYILSLKNTIIDAEIDKIKALKPELTIIEV